MRLISISPFYWVDQQGFQTSALSVEVKGQAQSIEERAQIQQSWLKENL